MTQPELLPTDRRRASGRLAAARPGLRSAPASGAVSASGASVPSRVAAGVSVSGVATPDVAARGVAGSGHTGSGHPASGHPASGHAASGVAAGPGSAWVALRRSGDLLAEAATTADRVRTYGLCRLAALNAAWAACAESVDDATRVGVGSPWELLVRVRPALAEWALVFTVCDRRWASVCRGGAVPSVREVDDLLREVGAFRRLVMGRSGRSPAGVRRSLP